jgi:CRISPR-associated protein Csm1
MPSTKSIIQLGLQLLKNGRLDANELGSYSDAFSILKVDVSKPLKLAALKSVFSTSDDQTAKYYKPSPLDPEHINYPCNSATPGDIPGFGEAEMAGSNELTLLEKYGTFVSVVTTTDTVDFAAHTQTPLYDLFKTAAAFDDCLKTGEGTEKFLLVGCDFSGIQDTVYTISSKGALKTLRARSFMLELLTEHIITEILEAAGAGRHTIIYSGGGGFGLLLPNKTIVVDKKKLSIKEIVEKYTDVLNNWALKEFSGRFFMAVDVQPFSPDALTSGEKFQSLRQTQADNLDKLKRRKFINQLDDLFKPQMPKQLTGQTECQITRRDDLDDDQMRDISVEFGEIMRETNKHEDGRVWVSESCFHQFNLGDRLNKANAVNRYTVFVKRTEKKNYGTLVFPGADSKDVFYKIDKSPDEGAERHWQINAWDVSEVFQYANYVRKHEDLSNYAQSKEIESLNEEGQHTPEPDHTATFQGLASSSCGADLIGALRMDVDNMGDLFRNIESVAALSTKSRMLNLFFKVYLNQICAGNLGSTLSSTDIVEKNYAEKNGAEVNKGRNVSVIYAGGDDLFILGAWDETTELAFDIQRCFALFTGRIFDTTKKIVTGGRGISGGLTLHQPKFPLYQMAKKSGEAERVAKHDKDTESDDVEKNRIALFFDDSKDQRRLNMQNPERYMLSMVWDLGNDFLLPLMKTYYECGCLKEQEGRCVLEIDKFSYQTIEKWFAVVEKYQESYKLYLPTMARVMSQVEENQKMDMALFKKLFSFLYTNDESKKNWISHLHIALNWLSFLRRTK